MHILWTVALAVHDESQLVNCLLDLNYNNLD